MSNFPIHGHRHTADNRYSISIVQICKVLPFFSMYIQKPATNAIPNYSNNNSYSLTIICLIIIMIVCCWVLFLVPHYAIIDRFEMLRYSLFMFLKITYNFSGAFEKDQILKWLCCPYGKYLWVQALFAPWPTANYAGAWSLFI